MVSLNLKNKKACDSHDESSSNSRYLDSQIKLSKNRNIFISEDFTKEMSAAVIALLLYYDNINHDDINIFINSNGGDVAALMAIYDAVQMIESPVKTVCLSKCYSAAAILLCTGSKGKRFALKHSQVMIHGLQCSFPIIGEADQINSENYYKFLDKTNMSIINILAKHTGKAPEQVKIDCSRDFYLTAQQALDYGLIDQII